MGHPVADIDVGPTIQLPQFGHVRMPHDDDVKAGSELLPREHGHVFDDTRLAAPDTTDICPRMRKPDADVGMKQGVEPPVEPAAHQESEAPRH